MNFLKITFVIALVWWSGSPVQGASIDPKLANNPAGYSRVAVAPIACAHYGYSISTLLTTPDTILALEPLSVQLCSNITKTIAGALAAKRYQITGPVRTLVTDEDWKQLGEDTRREFQLVRHEFGQISRVLHDEAKTRKPGPFEFSVGTRVSELCRQLDVAGVDALILVDEQCRLEWSGHYRKDGSVKILDISLRRLEFNFGVVDARTGALLWWNTGIYPDVIGKQMKYVAPTIQKILAPLPAARKNSGQ